MRMIINVEGEAVEYKLSGKLLQRKDVLLYIHIYNLNFSTWRERYV